MHPVTESAFFDELEKIAAASSKPSAEDKRRDVNKSLATTGTLTGGAVAGMLGSGLYRDDFGVPNPAEAAHQLVGSQPIYHGTGSENAASIRKNGLMPSLGGSSMKDGGLDAYVDHSKGRSFATTRKATAEQYSRMGGIIQDAKQRGITPDLTSGKGNGVVLRGAMPYEKFLATFSPDELHDPSFEAFHTQQNVGPEVFKSGLGSQLLNRVKNPGSLVSYVKSHPGRFGRGALGMALPAAALGLGGYSAKKRYDMYKEDHQKKSE